MGDTDMYEDSSVENMSQVLDPEHLPEPNIILTCQDTDGDWMNECTFYILGTAHVSRKSCEDVRTIIRKVRPEVVVIELCSERQGMLHVDRIKESECPTLGHALSEIRQGKATPFQAIYSWLISRVAADLDVYPGDEFRVAVKEAKKVQASVVLGDRPLSITLDRLWTALSFLEKVKLVISLLWTGIASIDTEVLRSDIEKMKEADVLTEAIKEFGKEFPSIVLPLLTERDQFMVHVMRRLASRSSRVVAIVGAGHLKGIREQWEQDLPIEEICRIRPRRPVLVVRYSLVIVAATSLFALYGTRWLHKR
eukprot:jgi/Picsp_1/3512/NSC_06350-R1_protein